MEGKSRPWTNVIIKSKKRKSEGSPESRMIDVREALIQMVDDSDHCVRMCMAKIVSSLYLDVNQMETYCQSVEAALPLLPRKEQESIFEKVSQTLTKAEMVEVNDCCLPLVKIFHAASVAQW